MEDAREMAETGGGGRGRWAVGFGPLGWLALYFFWVWLCCAGALAAACGLWCGRCSAPVLVSQTRMRDLSILVMPCGLRRSATVSEARNGTE